MKVNIKVIPNSKKEEIIEGNPIIVKVKERAEKNKANIAVIKLMPKHFKSKARIISGFTSRKKLLNFRLHRSLI